MNPKWLTMIMTLFMTTGLLTPPVSIHAIMSAQSSDATLRIVNDSEQTICYVLISPVTASSWGYDWLEGDIISPGTTYSFSLPPGEYHTLLLDCNENKLLATYNLHVSDLYELHFAGPDPCQAWNHEGMRYYYQAQYTEALQQFQEALSCYRKVGDRVGEGKSLNNISGVYLVQGRYDDALEMLEQALAINREVGIRELGDRASEGTMLNNIGKLYYAQGSYVKALEAYQQALVILREVGDREGEGTALNSIGAIYLDQGRYSRAMEFCQQALAVHQDVGDRSGEGVTLNNIGEIYLAQGHYAGALEAYQRALAIKQEVGDRAGEGITLNNIGALHLHQNHYTEALESFQLALVILQEAGDRASEGKTLNNIGQVHENQGRYAKALEFYRQALIIFQEIGDRASEGKVLNSIGGVYRAQGRYAEALESYQQALAIHRDVSDRASEGATLNGIGGVYHSQSRYGEALAIRQELGDRVGEGGVLNGIGVVYQAQGRYGEALDAFQEAMIIYRDVGNWAGEGSALSNIGVISAEQGLYAEALAFYQQALVIVQEIDDLAHEGTILNNIGLVHYKQESYAEAFEFYQQALAIHQQVGDRAGEGGTLNNIGLVYDAQERYAQALESYQQALAIWWEVGDRVNEGNTLNNIGHAYQSQGEVDPALAHYEQAMEIFESLRAVAGSEAGRTDFIAQWAHLYDRAVELYHQQDQDTQAFHTSERGRARAFLDSLATGYVELSDDEVANLVSREQAAYAVRQAAQDALVQARAQESLDPDLEVQLAAAEQEHAAALAAIEARGDQLAALVPGRGAVLEQAEVQALLDEQTTLVSYYVLGDEGALAFIITQDDLTVVELPDATPDNLLRALVDQYQWLNLENPYPLPLRNLHAWLVAPLAEHLHTSLVGIIPHRSLHYVPFAALTDGEVYFGQQHTLFTLPSASVLRFIQKNAQQAAADGRRLAVVVGNPATGDYDLVASLATERDAFGDLPFAEKEAGAVAALYGVEPLLGQDATEGTVRAQSPQADILHLAAHGEFNPVAPLSSLIALAPNDEYDGWLTVGEVYGLDLNRADLVVLSACETQLGDLSAGDELVGLTRAFIFAGTPSIIASLWSVDDAATEELMVVFYQHLQAGMGKAEALQAAQAGVRENYPSPYYWAAFVLSGDPGAVARAIPSPTKGLVSLADTQPPETESKGSGGMCGTLGLVVPLLLLGVRTSWRRRRFQ